MCIDENGATTPKETNAAAAVSQAGKTPRGGALKPGSSATNTVKGDDSQVVTPTMLAGCLAIFTILIKEDPENEFFVEGCNQVKEIITSSFGRAHRSGEQAVRRNLMAFLTPLLSITTVPVRVQVDSNLLLRINVLLEKFLDADEPIEHGLSATDRGPRGKEKQSDFIEVEYSPACFALEIIEGVCGSQPDFFKTFLSALLALGTVLAKKHTAEASSKNRQGNPSLQAGTLSTPKMFFSPTEGILDEACGQEPLLSLTGGNSKLAVGKEIARTTKDIGDIDSKVKCLLMILRILENADVPFCFSQHRKPMMHLLSNILDASDSVQLTMAAIRLVGKWLLVEDCRGPITVKERNSFLWKLAAFDFNGLPDIISQPLGDLVAHYVIAFIKARKPHHDFTPGITDVIEVTNEEFPVSILPKASESDDMVIGRSLVACLVTANEQLRSELLSLFAARCGEAVPTNRQPESPQRPTSNVTWFLGRSPSDVLWQLLHSDFELLGGRLWLLVFIELLLGSSNPDGGVRLVPRLGRDQDDSIFAKYWMPTVRRKSIENLDASAISDSYYAFCEIVINEQSEVGRGQKDCLSALRRLAHGDFVVCQRMLNTLLRDAWRAISGDGTRLALVPAIESLLSRPFHSQSLLQSGVRYAHAKQRPRQRTINSIRSFLGAVGLMNPVPIFNVELLVSLAENYNAWHEVITLLEQQYTILSLTMKLAEVAASTLSAIRHCYRQLHENDIFIGLACLSCRKPETHWAASLDVYGKVKEAATAYEELMDEAEVTSSLSSLSCQLEMDLWEERWVQLQKELCQNAVVAEYAATSESPILLLECAWKAQEWDKVRVLSTSSSLVATIEAGDPRVKMSETLLAVADGKLSEVENLHAQTAQLCLHRWQLLPNVMSGSHAHGILLQFFHRLVELRESGQIMVETSNHSSGRTLPDLKNLLR
jgi:transformation/transcription domain-associated protein